MKQSILVATDFTPRANNAVQYAARMSQFLQAPLTIVHACGVPVSAVNVAYPIGVQYPGELDDDYLKVNARESLKDLLEKHEEISRVNPELLVEVGFANDVLAELYEQDKYGLMILGARGGQELAEVFGSTTTALIKKVKKPVMAIPDTVNFEEPKKMVLATDFNTDVTEELLDIYHEFSGAEIHIVHLTENLPLNSEQALRKKELKSLLEQSGLNFVLFELGGADKDTVLMNYIQKSGTNILSVVPHEHSFFDKLFKGSFTKHLCFTTETPLLVLKK